LNLLLPDDYGLYKNASGARLKDRRPWNTTVAVIDHSSAAPKANLAGSSLHGSKP
jgi:hypothetical protein